MAQRPETKLRTHLPILIHHADHMAARIEYEKWANTESPLEKKQPVKFRPQNSTKGRSNGLVGSINKTTFNKFFED